MKRTVYALGAALSLAALLPMLVFAQAAGSSFVSVSSAPASSSNYSPGTQNAMLGTVTLTGTQPGSVQIQSLPLMLTTTGGASATDLSGCQIINNNNTALNTGANIPSAIAGSGATNTFMLDTPLSINYNSPTTLSVRCNIATTAPYGSGYAFSVGTPTLIPSLGISLTSFPTISPGEIAAPIAAITLNPSASGSNMSVSALPLMVNYGGSLTPADLSNCSIRSLGSSLSGPYAQSLAGGTNTLTLSSPLALTGGGSAVPLMLTCDVSANAPYGSTLGVSLTPSSIPTMVAGTNTSVTPQTSVNSSTGLADPTSGVTTVAAANSSGTTNTGTGTSGIVAGPNTGGADPMLLALLALAAALGIGGVSLYTKSKKA